MKRLSGLVLSLSIAACLACSTSRFQSITFAAQQSETGTVSVRQSANPITHATPSSVAVPSPLPSTSAAAGLAITPPQIDTGAVSAAPDETGDRTLFDRIAARTESITRNGPDRDGWLLFDLDQHAKVVVGGFAQGAMLGMGLQLTTGHMVPGVELRATAIASPLLCRRFEAEAYVPKIFDTKTHADLWLDYLYRNQDEFFGIGPNTPRLFQPFDYGIEQRSVNAAIFHDFIGGMQAGAYTRLANTGAFPGRGAVEFEGNRISLVSAPAVSFSPFAPGLLDHTEILSSGAFWVLDKRDNSAGLTRGGYLYARAGYSLGLDDVRAFSNYRWFETELDARAYLPLGTNKTSLAVRAYADTNFATKGNLIPFYDMPYLGGQMDLRGFEDYRFRGDNLALFSAELRRTIWAHLEARGLDIIGFADAGQVWGDNRFTVDPAIAPGPGFSSRNWKAGIGGGLQYRFSRVFAARVELGHSNERTIAYLSMTRGF